MNVVKDNQVRPKTHEGIPVKKAEPILVYVTVSSGRGGDVRVKNEVIDDKDYKKSVRGIYMTSIYNNGLRRFLLDSPLVRLDNHEFKGPLTYEAFNILSRGVLNGLWYQNKNFFDSGLIGIDIFVNQKKLEDLFDSYEIFTESDYLRNLFNEEPLESVKYYRNPTARVDFFENYNDKKIEEILETYNLYEYEPLELPYENFDLNKPFMNSNCMVQMLIDRYCTGNGKGISLNSIHSNFKKFTYKELSDFCKKYTINLQLLDVFGNTVVRNKIPDNKMKNRKKDLYCIIFNNHVYPYTKKLVYGNNPDMKIEHYNETLFLSDTSLNEGMDQNTNTMKAKIEFSKTFTNNFSYVAEKNLCPKSLKYLSEDHELYKEYCDFNVHDIELEKTEDISYSINNNEIKDRLYYYKNKNIKSKNLIVAEIDMSKAFHNTMINLQPNIPIPIFAVDSMILDYNNEEIDDCNIYFLKEKSLEKTEVKLRGLIGNYHHGFLIRYLLKNSYITKHDIEYYKQYNRKYNLNDYRNKVSEIISEYNLDVYDDQETKAKGNLAEEMVNMLFIDDNTEDSKKQKYTMLNNMRKEYNSIQTFKDVFMLYNGICGMSSTTNKSLSVKVPLENAEKEEKLLRLKNPHLSKTLKTEDQDYVVFNRKSTEKYKYINNRNIYDYCISATNYQMLKAYNRFTKRNDHEIIRINTDCITFAFSKNEYIILDSFLNKNFRFKKVKFDTMSKTPSKYIYTDPIDIINGINNELKEMSNNVVSYLGGPGTGKTYQVKKEHKYDLAITISNVCCRNMDTENVKADTICSSFNTNTDMPIGKRLKKFYNKTIWFDEFSMFDIEYFNYIFLLIQLKKAKIIISGDINQIGPFNSKDIDRNNEFFKHLFSNCIELKENHRVKKVDENGNTYVDEDCKKLLDLSDLILKNLEEPDNCKTLLKNYYNNQSIEDIKMHLTYTIAMRNKVNDYIFNKNNHVFKLTDQIEISNGLRLVVKVQSKNDEIYKSVIYEYRGETGKYRTISLYNITLDKEEKIDIKFIKNMGLGFAVTTHSSQGLTIKEKCCIHQADKMVEVDPKIFYTALTRPTKMSDLVILSEEMSNSI